MVTDKNVPGAESLLRAVIHASRCLVANPNLNLGLSAAIEVLGEATGAGRVYVLQRAASAVGWSVAAEFHLPEFPSFTDMFGDSLSRDADFPAVVATLLAGHVYQPVAQDHPGDKERLNEEFNTRSDLILPILLNGTVWGCIGFDDCASSRHWTEAEIRVLKDAVAVIAAAVDRGAAESALRESVARERERAAESREAEARRISDFLTATLGNLAEGADLQRSIESIVMGLAREVGAAQVSLFRRDAVSRTLRLEFACADGTRMWHGPTDEITPLLAAPFSEDITPAWRIMTERRGLFTGETDLTIPLEEFAWPGSLEYAVRVGLSELGHIVLFAGDEPIGSIGLGLRDRRFKASDTPFIEGVAKQAALAMRMADLAEEAKKAAVAVEQQRFALERTAELALANQALKATLGTLAAGTSGCDLIHGILAVVQETMGAVSVALRIRDPRTLATIADDRYDVESCGSFPGFAKLMAPRSPLFLPVADDETLPAVVKSRFAAQGVLSQFAVPLLLGEELVGAIMVQLPRDHRPANERVELAIALGHQATLAIRMTQLTAIAKEEARAKAVSDERAAMARELHDTLLQSFTGITLQLRGLCMRPSVDESVQPLLASIELQATEAVQEARAAVGQLRKMLAGDLPNHLSWLIDMEKREAQCAARAHNYRFQQRGENWTITPFVAMGMARIVREALRNASRHSGASMVETDLQYLPGAVFISVKDDGCGFDLEEALAKPGHYGLQGMRERAHQIGASLQIESEKGRGTSILVKYPSDKLLCPPLGSAS